MGGCARARATRRGWQIQTPELTTLANHQSRNFATTNVEPVTTTMSLASALRRAIEKRVDRIADSAAPDAELFSDARQPLRPDRRSSRNAEEVGERKRRRQARQTAAGSPTSSLLSTIAITNEKRRSGNAACNAATRCPALSGLCATSKTTPGWDGKNSMRPGMTSRAKPLSICARAGRRSSASISSARIAVAAFSC